MNKVTGGMLFLLPLTLATIDLRYSAAVVCMVATIAAVNERHLILAEGNYLRTGREK
jgi:CDP-diacylglycerol--glycerol-3-phosphate 3-phosphatidyltransferase